MKSPAVFIFWCRMKDENYMDKWIGIKKGFGQTWEIVAYTGVVLKSGIYLGSYFDAYEYIKAFASSWHGIRPVVLKEDGTEWEYPKKSF